MASARTRRRGHRSGEEIDSNLTSMLDVIFNILAFFVVTFNPPKPEKNFDISLPPPKKEETEVQQQTEGEIQFEFDDVTVRLVADAAGALEAIYIDSTPVEGLGRLPQAIQRIDREIRGGSLDGKGLRAANIVSDPNLKYGYVIQVVDALYQNRIQEVNFAGGG